MPSPPEQLSDDGGVAASKDHPGTPPRGLPKGIYVPMVAFFTLEAEEVDLTACQRHAARLLQAGAAGIVVHGSSGEAPHLRKMERFLITQAVADTMREEHPAAPGATTLPLIAGCGAQSVRETVILCVDALRAGATHALVLPPAYYSPLLSRSALSGFFLDVARRSPIPVLVYNYPAAANGIDLDSDFIADLAAAEPNIVGVKLTCGNTGKLARIVHRPQAVGRPDFFVASGSADSILQGAVVGAHGSIPGLANLAPRACIEILRLHQRRKADDARRLQALVAQADWAAMKHGFVAVKMAVPRFHPRPAEFHDNIYPRRPLTRLDPESWSQFQAALQPLQNIETRLELTMANGTGPAGHE